MALPEVARHGPRGFRPPRAGAVRRGRPRAREGLQCRLAGTADPEQAVSPLVGTELNPGRIRFFSNARCRSTRHTSTCPCRLKARRPTTAPRSALGKELFLGTDRPEIAVELSSDARVLLLGGAPFEEEIVMWWNFVARTHDEIEQARAQWNAGGDPRFGEVDYPSGERLDAPTKPVRPDRGGSGRARRAGTTSASVRCRARRDASAGSGAGP